MHRRFYLLRRQALSPAPSQAEPLGHAALPGVPALLLPLLLHHRLELVLCGAVFGARLLREEIWEREGLSVCLRRGERLQPAGACAAGGPGHADSTFPPPYPSAHPGRWDSRFCLTHSEALGLSPLQSP